MYAQVGYGDIGIETDASKLFAVIHILSCVSWLANLLSLVGASMTQRRFDVTRA